MHPSDVVRRQNLARALISDANAVLDLFWLLFITVHAAARSHRELLFENLHPAPSARGAHSFDS